MIHPAIYIPLLAYAVFILFIWRGLKRKEKVVKSEEKPFLSVVVPCRNEEENIQGLLDSLVNQDYPAHKYEIILIDDNSTDVTADKANAYKSDKNIILLRNESGDAKRGFKKNAIETGIDAAKGEIIVSTDADCRHSENWLSQIAASFDKETGFIAGPVKLKPDHSLFSRLQALEFAGLMLSAAGLIKAGFPVTCSAANIAYRKKAFHEVGGYKDNNELSSGDDELLMHKIDESGKYKVRYLWEPSAVVTTTSANKLKDFFEQRRRWASKTLFYKKPFLTFTLALIYLFFLSIPVSFLAAFFYPVYWDYLITALGTKILVDFLVMGNGRNFFYDGYLLRYFGLAELLHAPYIIISAFAGLFGNFEWKERKLER
ncbi:MAG: glycosyl transferase [Melioribacteraceae bacterium]|nr:MAG: glycosyl transferase [Melioribacteraceae bacterium]